MEGKNRRRFAYMGGGKYEMKQLEVEPVPDNLDFDIYSSLIGLLATNGATLQLGFNWFWDYRTVYLRLSHPKLEFLDWLVDIFESKYFVFDNKEYTQISSSGSVQIRSLPSHMCYILWLHWNEQGTHVLPFHFEKYFSIRTLAVWAMRNGQWKGNAFIIHVNRLNDLEKTLLISLIKDKLGYDSYLTMNKTKLAICNPAKLVQELQPLFHSTQQHRLNKNRT